MHGLNSRAKRTVIRTIITSASPYIVYLQETKVAVITFILGLKMLGPMFRDFF